MNPLAAKLLGGKDFREQLQAQLFSAAENTDDPAYRKRLLEVANGERPLKTLMNDPAFQSSQGLSEKNLDQQLKQAQEELDQSASSPAEVQARLKSQLEQLNVQIPSMEELKSLFGEVQEMQKRTDSFVMGERQTGWGGSVERLAQESKDK